MDHDQNIEDTPRQLFERAKQHKHKYNISTEAFTCSGRDFVVHNLTLKKDYADPYDFNNYRRGYATLEEIVEFKHSPMTVARKGLRKFRDMMPEYLQLRDSHVNRSKYHHSEKQRLFADIDKGKHDSYAIYNTEKLNGENAQISWAAGEVWVVGTKNKVLLLESEQSMEGLKNRVEHKLTLLVAQAWFALLKGKTEEQMRKIKQCLSQCTLVGEYCNSENMQHLVDYGKQPQLFFYALVEKENRNEDCRPTSAVLQFLEETKLPVAKVEKVQARSREQLLEVLREMTVRVNQLSMKQGGQGSVLYVSGVFGKVEQTLMVCKLKTIEYRIYRKLRQKLKIYIRKLNKHYDHLLKQLKKQIEEIARQFNLKQPLQQYFQTATKAFALCVEQTRPVSKFVHNRFIDFLKLVQKGITKEKFMEIVQDKHWEIGPEEEEEEEQGEKPIERQVVQEAPQQKKVLVLIPMCIPSTGKTTLLQLMNTMKPSFRLWSISSDQVRNRVMGELMKRVKSREQAFKKSRQPANKQYYQLMADTFKSIAQTEGENHLFYLDKNHPESALKETIKQINKNSETHPHLKVLKVALLPDCKHRLEEKGKYRYPFSPTYILSCLKRVINRPEHLTLEGSETERCKIVLGFTNLFRNFSLSPYNLGKHFDRRVDFPFSNEECLSGKGGEMVILLKEVLLGGKPGDFEYAHPRLEELVKDISQWQLAQLDRQKCAQVAFERVEAIFADFVGGFEGQEKQS